jgi:D-3-phosphoglycerate dehydrogenase
VAAVSRVLGAEVGYTDHYVDTTEYQRFDDIMALAEWADVLTIHLPRDESTRHSVNAEVLTALGHEGVVVNTARGGLIDEEALFEALSEGRIAGAALDVYESEPYSGPLTTLPNVMLTCHMGSYARQVRAAMETEALQNALDHLGIT